MTYSKILLTTLAAAGAWWLPGQDGGETPLAPVPGPAQYAEEWAEALRSPDLAERRRAYDEVLEGAQRSSEVRELVERWNAEADDVELAWTAELLLRELDRTPDGSFRRGAPGDPWSGMRPPDQGFGWRSPRDLFREMEEMFDRPLGGMFFGHGNPFGSLDDWQKRSSSHGLRLETGPDGVKVEIRENVDGEEKVTTYEAESMEALLEQHPELKDKLGDGTGIQGFTFDMDGLHGFGGPNRWEPGGGFGRGLPWSRPDTRAQPGVGPMRTDVLGVRVVPPEARGTEIEGLPADVGLQVVEVLPGTLAAELGIEPGEIVVKLNGEDVRSAEDVKRILAERADDEDVEVQVMDEQGERFLRSWKPRASGTRRTFVF